MCVHWSWSLGSINLNTFPHPMVTRTTSFVLHIFTHRFFLIRLLFIYENHVQLSINATCSATWTWNEEMSLFVFHSNWRKICRLIYEIKILKSRNFTYCATNEECSIFDYLQLFVPYVIQLSISRVTSWLLNYYSLY